MGCHSLLQRIFSTQGSNPGLLHYRQIFYHLSYQGSPKNLGLSINSPLQFSSVQSSHSVMSDSLRPYGLQHFRLPCPSPTPGSYSNSCPSRRFCHPAISSSVVPFSSYLQSFPASESFPVSEFFSSGGQSIGVSSSTVVLSINIQD